MLCQEKEMVGTCGRISWGRTEGEEGGARAKLRPARDKVEFQLEGLKRDFSKVSHVCRSHGQPPPHPLLRTRSRLERCLLSNTVPLLRLPFMGLLALQAASQRQTLANGVVEGGVLAL